MTGKPAHAVFLRTGLPPPALRAGPSLAALFNGALGSRRARRGRSQAAFFFARRGLIFGRLRSAKFVPKASIEGSTVNKGGLQ